MEYLEDSLLEEEISFGLNFGEMKHKLKKELHELEILLNKNKDAKDIIKKMYNILEWYC